MKQDMWPRGPFYWQENDTLKISIPFTWNLDDVRAVVARGSLAHNRIIVGGPAVDMMPNAFADLRSVEIGKREAGVLQRINPLATRTTIGCSRKCQYCAIGTGKIERGGFRVLKEWRNLPIVCDNNLLLAPMTHFQKVIFGLVKWGWADFNQGIDARLLTVEHAKLFARIKRPIVRLALDSMRYSRSWEPAVDRLRSAGIAKTNIRSYALIGFEDDEMQTPDEAWDRCRYIEKHAGKANPMWYHRLDARQANVVTKIQKENGWNDYERRRIMQWFYYHKEAVR